MPGRVIMDQHSSEPGSHELKKDHGALRQDGAQTLPAAVGSPHATVNGDAGHGRNGHTPNGVAQKNDSDTGTNGTMTSLPLRDPPPLDQSWRDAPENKSLGVLLERTAQQCFFELNEVINKMAAAGQPGQSTQPGVGAVEDTDAVSLGKKRQLLEFAQAQRDRFIKALVITDWSRNADEMARVIDINAYHQKGNWQHSEATRSIGQLKIDMLGAKMPNPNLDGALEILATGKPRGVPDLGYVPAPRLTAKQLLKTLKSMNVTLATRLALHEDVPKHFADYTIKDGRATFTVPGEFDVDLAVADEDPTSSWFFIDIRFLFNPAPDTIDERIKFYFEAEVNRTIASNGLQGCYDIVHNFVLTHKVNVLHSQANDLLRGKWFECIKVERMRRNLVLQYWAGKPGKKSWLEFGIASGKQGKLQSGHKQATPIIAVRWFQTGVEVLEVVLDIDWSNIDLEGILQQAIAKQTTSNLTSVQNGLRSLAPNAPGLSAEIQRPEGEAAESVLVLQLQALDKPLRVLFEPVTGQYSILPASPAAASAERRLNNDPMVDVPRCLAGTLCSSALSLVEKHISPLGWLPVVNLARHGNLIALFGEDIVQFRLFVPNKFWGDLWAIAITVGLSGNKWWIVHLEANAEGDTRLIHTTTQIKGIPDAEKPVSRRSLLHIEKLAVAEVSYTALSLQLQELHIPHQSEMQSSLTSVDGRPPAPRKAAIFFGFTKLMQQRKNKKWKAWAQEPVLVTHYSKYLETAVEESSVRTRQDVRLSLQQGRFKALQRHLSKSRNRDVAINPTGGLALKLFTPFGTSLVKQLRARLSCIERLDRYVSILKNYKVRCDSVSLSRLVFTYSPNPDLTAQLTYSNDGGLPVKLKLLPSESNPHMRLRVLLEQALNRTTAPEAFAEIVRAFLSTLPILRAFEGLQSQHPHTLSPILHVRAPTCWSLKYRAPLPQITLQIRMRTRIQGSNRITRWHIEQQRTKVHAEDLPEGLLADLRQLWSTNSQDYFGSGRGINGTSNGIARALEQIDGIVRRYGRSAPTAAKPDGAAKGSKPAVKDKREVIALD